MTIILKMGKFRIFLGNGTVKETGKIPLLELFTMGAKNTHKNRLQLIPKTMPKSHKQFQNNPVYPFLKSVTPRPWIWNIVPFINVNRL